ncbi:hypothetical protein FIU93_28125 [Labrenzia sp. THAF35]|uniref:DUF4376 domain-containing protein n=1 Tax=Labrenzia sp. THAF35 TaxID=2587854 RepID=UPI0012694FA0|nr:DUF4376 domain-containing protein [Labrenzia sp. THAF35]QFT70684.1 hypothetical protein FIU93_28125 [Labrenzia sp. THAF35]
MQVTEIHFTDETETRVEVTFTQDGAERSGSWAWPIRDDGKAEAVAAFLAAQDPALLKPALKPVPGVTNDQINAARDRRIDAGITFNGVLFQTRPEDRENIQGAYSRAQSAILIDGAQPGDFTWHGGLGDFEWIAANDSRVKMDAQTMMAFGEAVLDHKSAHIFAANAIKAMDPVPSDFDEIAALWP